MDEIRHTFHIGVNAIVVRSGKILLGKRKGIFGAGTWGLPGGHLEPGEGMEDAVRRELREETGLEATSYQFQNLVNDKTHASGYIQIGFLGEGVLGEPVVREPDQCEEWGWFEKDKLPEIFPPHKPQIELFFEGTSFKDA